MRRGQVGGGGLREGAAGLDGAAERPEAVGVEPPGEVGGAEEGVLAGQHLPRAGEFEQHAGVGAGLGVLDAGQRAVDGEACGHGGGVRGVDLVPVGAAVGRGGAEPAQSFGLHDEGGDAVGDVRGEASGVADGVPGVEAEPGDGCVGAPDPLLELGGASGSGGGHLAYGGGAFVLEGGDGGGDGLPDVGVDRLEEAEAGDVLGGGDGGESPQGEQRDDRDHEEGDDLRADGTGAQPAHAAAGGGVRCRSVAAAAAGGRGGSGGSGGGRVGADGLAACRLLGGPSGVRPASAGRPGRLRRGLGLRGRAGSSHGLLVPSFTAGR